ncbi:DUF4136 domain-containing protein [Aliivibrio finisterrensis]|uniref:DUF4136 domain-containing protein n=1 Tax=Aliivibrio finisterrensis TaxID=511998 RepID=A0A6N6RVH5_9GAMM|nr:DUF4136 domain-containing protein [Aliivibrio finisterrensis]
MKYFLSFLLLTFVTGCVSETYQEKSTVNLVTIGNINDVIAGKRTFAWHPNINANYLNSTLNENNTEQRFIKSLKNELTEKGFIYTDNPTFAEFYVGYGLGIESAISDTKILNETGLQTGLQPLDNKNEADKASIFIAVFLPNQINSSWSVLAQGYTNTEDNRKTAMDELLHFMFHSLNKTSNPS